MSAIKQGPHYEIDSSELAAWLESQGVDRWWNVDGDPLLTGRVSFPCPADELAAELRAINRPLLLHAKNPDAKGQRIDRTRLDELVSRLFGNLPANGRGSVAWPSDRLFYFCWKDSPYDWMLIEDSLTTKAEMDQISEAK